MNIPLPDNGIPVKIGDSFYVYKDVYHPITWIGGIPYRPRVETLIIKDGTLIYLHLKKGLGSSGVKGTYELPGGSIDRDATMSEQAENEVNEEALISVKNIYDTGIQYYEKYPEGFLMNGGDSPLEYKGHISNVFIAEYSGIYEKGAVEKKDLDPKIAHNGKFYRISDVARLLKEEHCTALLNSPYVKESTKGVLRILNQMNLKELPKDLQNFNGTNTVGDLIFVSKFDKLSQISPEPTGSNKNWKKISVFNSVKHALEYFDVTKHKLHNNSIVYVYAIDAPHSELSLYTPSNDDSPSSKITGELWIKTMSSMQVKRLGMIQIKTDGTLGYFYSGKRSEHKHEVLSFDFNWIIRDTPTNSVLESSVVVPGNKLYHGTTYEIDKFEPRSLDLGNVEEEPGWSTFAFADYKLALRFGLMRAIQKMNDYWKKDVTCSWSLTESKPYLSASDFSKISSAIQGFRFFVYTIDASNLDVGIGNDDRLQEYTFRESGILPEKEEVFHIDSSMLKEHLLIIPDAKISAYIKDQEDVTKENHVRGWYGAFMTRDYNNGDASHQLQKACKDGKLQPGDDVRNYMNINGISFDEDYIRYSSIQESVISKLDNDYSSKGKKNLSSLKKIPLSNESVKMYKSRFKMLSHIRTSDSITGFIYILDNDCAVIAVEEKANGQKWIQALEITKGLRGYGLSNQMLDIATDRLGAEYLSVNKKNEVALNLYKKNGWLIMGSTETMYFMTTNRSNIKSGITESTVIGSHCMYFLSELNMNGKTLNPRIPDNFMTKNGYEDNHTKRVCFAPTIDKALMGISQNMVGKQLFVHIPAKGINRAHIIKPTKTQVPDADITGEIWLTEPVELKCVGKIRVDGDKGLPGHKYNYGSNTAELYDWNWTWIEKYTNGQPVIEKLSFYKDNTISYSTDKKYVKEIIDTLPIYEKQFIGNHVDDNFSSQFVSHTKNLKYREVLLADNIPVAFLDVYTMPEMNNDEGTIVLSVRGESKYRRKGYGSTLVKRMEQRIAKKTGITKLIWEYDRDNIKSGMMGISLGYKGNALKLSKTLENAQIETSEILEVAQYSSTNKYPVFITLMHTGTKIATLIKTVTQDEFSHATISFNAKLSPQYSFGTKKLGGRERGLVIHGTNDPFYDMFKTTYAVYVMYISRDQREKMLTRLQYFIDHEDTLKYDAPALVACFLHIPTEFRKKYFCSRFVMEIIGEGQELTKLPSLWKPQEIASLENVSLVNAGDDFRKYDYKITNKNLKLIKAGRQDEIRVDAPVSESTRSELPDELFGLPEYRKYPLDTKQHVQSAIKFFNYVSPENEKELAENILRRMGELNISQPAVTKRNRFIKYVSESYYQIKDNMSNRVDWSLMSTLSNDERQKLLKAASPFMNSPLIYTNSAYVGEELAGVIHVFRDHDREDFGHIFCLVNPKFIDFAEINEILTHEAQVEFTDPMKGIEWVVTDYCNQPGWYLDIQRPPETDRFPAVQTHSVFTDGHNNQFVTEQINIFESGYFDEYKKYVDLDELMTDVNESLILSKTDIEHNLDSWGSNPKYNLLLVTGLSGSGKTTTTYKLASINKADVFQLDWIEHPENIEKQQDGFDYGLRQYILTKHRRKLMNRTNMNGDEYHDLVISVFESIIVFAQSHSTKLFIVEGVQIPGHLHDYPGIEKFPIIIKGTSVLKSAYQRFKRDDMKTFFKTGNSNILKWYLNAEKYFNLFRNQIQSTKVDVTDVTETWIPLMETTLFNKKDVHHKVEDFESGKTNILFITGLSGSGKSTMARQLVAKHNAVYIELDIIAEAIDKDHWIDKSPASSNAQSIYLAFKKSSNYQQSKNDKVEQLYQFIQFVIQYALRNKSSKFIVEGVQLADLEMSDELIRYPLIVTGTSAIKSTYNATVKREHMSLRDLIKYAPDMFKESIDFDKGGLAQLRKTIPVSETWIPLMEAPKAADNDRTGETSEDYTNDVQEPDADMNADMDDSVEEESDDYTEDVPDTQEDNSGEEDNEESGENSNEDNLEIDEPTDYTEGESSDSFDESDDSSDESDTTNTDKNDNLFDNNVLKNYSLLKNFEKLYELTKEVSDSLDAKVEPTKLQNAVLAQVLKNLNVIKEFILSYVKFQFSQDNYSQNLYYYNIVIQSLKLNLELLKRNNELGERKSK